MENFVFKGVSKHSAHIIILVLCFASIDINDTDTRTICMQAFWTHERSMS